MPTQFDLTDAVRRLRLFNEKAAELSSLSFASKAFAPNAGATLHIHGSEAVTEKIGADREATAALVLTLRLFVQSRDNISIKQIQSLYEDLPIDDDRKHWVRVNSATLNSILNGTDCVSIAVNGQTLTNRDILDTFMYGDLAHVDRHKRELFETIQRGPARLLLEKHV